MKLRQASGNRPSPEIDRHLCFSSGVGEESVREPAALTAHKPAFFTADARENILALYDFLALKFLPSAAVALWDALLAERSSE